MEITVVLTNIDPLALLLYHIKVGYLDSFS